MKGSKQRMIKKNMKGNFAAACAASALTLMVVVDLLFSKIAKKKNKTALSTFLITNNNTDRMSSLYFHLFNV